MRFCFVCSVCDYRVETTVRDPAPTCVHPSSDAASPPVSMRRDYQIEGVGLGSGVKVSRNGTDHERAKLFLPDNDEYAGPGDPDGTIGMRNWMDTHQPQVPGGDFSMVPGTIERKSF